MKATIAIALLTASGLVMAAGQVYGPAGTDCYEQNGNVYCDSTGSNSGASIGYDNGAAAAAIEAAKVTQARAKELDKCLRKADWPGQPSRSECRSMYSN